MIQEQTEAEASAFFAELREQTGEGDIPVETAPPALPQIDPQCPLDDPLSPSLVGGTGDTAYFGALLTRLEVLDARVAARAAGEREIDELRHLVASRGKNVPLEPRWLLMAALAGTVMLVPHAVVGAQSILFQWRSPHPVTVGDVTKAEAEARAAATRQRAEELAIRASEEFTRLRTEPIAVPVPELATNPRRPVAPPSRETGPWWIRDGVVVYGPGK